MAEFSCRSKSELNYIRMCVMKRLLTTLLAVCIALQAVFRLQRTSLGFTEIFARSDAARWATGKTQNCWQCFHCICRLIFFGTHGVCESDVKIV